MSRKRPAWAQIVLDPRARGVAYFPIAVQLPTHSGDQRRRDTFGVFGTVLHEKIEILVFPFKPSKFCAGISKCIVCTAELRAANVCTYARMQAVDGHLARGGGDVAGVGVVHE
jgi:hypothetical protein